LLFFDKAILFPSFAVYVDIHLSIVWQLMIMLMIMLLLLNTGINGENTNNNIRETNNVWILYVQ